MANNRVTDASARECIELHRLMVLGRALDRALAALSQQRGQQWFTSIGEDGVIVAATYGLERGDVVATHYRGSSIVSLVRGVPLATVVATCLGTVDSYNRGRMRGDVAGSFEHGVIGCYSGNLGPQPSYGTGAAWAMKLQRRKNVVVVMSGDGTAVRGEFHESAKFAAVRGLPVVYLRQDDEPARTSTPARQALCRPPPDRECYGMPCEQVDGNDVLAVRQVVGAAVDRARRGEGPTLIDAVTQRAQGGRGSLEPRAQPEEEIAAWTHRDPLERLEGRMLRDGSVTESVIAACHAEAARNVNAAIAHAMMAGLPEADELDPELVYAPT